MVWFLVIALLAVASPTVMGTRATSDAAGVIVAPDWNAVAAALENPGEPATIEKQKRDTGVVARPLTPPDGHGRTVMLEPLPPHSIIGKGAGLILEKAPSRGRP